MRRVSGVASSSSVISRSSQPPGSATCQSWAARAEARFAGSPANCRFNGHTERPRSSLRQRDSGPTASACSQSFALITSTTGSGSKRFSTASTRRGPYHQAAATRVPKNTTTSGRIQKERSTRRR